MHMRMFTKISKLFTFVLCSNFHERQSITVIDIVGLVTDIFVILLLSLMYYPRMIKNKTFFVQKST